MQILVAKQNLQNVPVPGRLVDEEEGHDLGLDHNALLLIYEGAKGDRAHRRHNKMKDRS